jgi:hypothetical protein
MRVLSTPWAPVTVVKATEPGGGTLSPGAGRGGCFSP